MQENNQYLDPTMGKIVVLNTYHYITNKKIYTMTQQELETLWILCFEDNDYETCFAIDDDYKATYGLDAFENWVFRRIFDMRIN